MNLPTLPDPKEAEQQAHHALTLLCDQMHANIMAGATEISLHRQAQLLEYAFAFFLRRGLNPATWDTNKLISLALKSQSQCVETLRTETAMRYMEALTPASGLKIYPHPLPEKAPNE